MLLNLIAILGVIAYFINKDGRRRHVVLGLRELVSEYSSENIVVALVELFKEYKIGSNFSYFMADNAELNNKAIKAVLQALYLGILAKK